MANIFASKKAVKDEKVEEDRLGGAGVLSSDLYPATIKAAYLMKAASSNSQSLNLILDINGSERTATLWVIGSNGEVTYEKDGKTHNLQGYNQANSIAMLLLSKELEQLVVEERTVNIYDFDEKKQLPKSVDCFVELHDKELQVAVQEQKVDKQQKTDQTDERGKPIYENTGETRNVNEYVKFFPAGTPVTISEVARYISELGGDFDDVLADGDLGKAIGQMTDEHAQYIKKWLEKNRGEVYDRSKGKSKGAGKTFGGSNRSSGSDGESKPKKSLFDD